MELGWCDVCLAVGDIAATREFYEKLGFRRVDGKDDEGWTVVTNGDLRLGLYEKQHMGESKFTLNFRGSNIGKLVDSLSAAGVVAAGDVTIRSDGSGSATYHDPDGVVLFFDSAPGESMPN